MSSPVSPRGRISGRQTAILVLLLVALAGGLAGIALDRLLLLPGPHGGSSFYHGPGRHPPRDREFRRRFAGEVGLSAEQQAKVDSIMDQQGRELRTIRRQVQPQLDSIIGRTRRELDSILTPEQREKAAEIRRRHPWTAGPAHDEPAPGAPPGPAR